VQAALRLTPQDEVQSFARAVEGRVTALARAHTLLADGAWEGAELRDLVTGELRPFLAPAPDGPAPRAAIEGPPALLGPQAAQAVSMAVHELATNATKYGALSAAGGRVEVSWTIGPRAGLLRIAWRERGGPPIAAPPERRGFGSRLLEATVQDQLGGTVRRRWDGAGLACEIELPLDRALAGTATDAAAG
jgi:two-component sensor histidine kinase